MRYRPEHKEMTRERIIDAAGELFRRHGYDGVGIDQIMSAARLTRGGFYGYFNSKSALFAQVIRAEHGFNAMLARRSGGTTAELGQQAQEIVEGYLHPDNRAEIGAGCSMASLSVDVARAGEPAQDAFSLKLRDLAAEFARGLDDAGELDARALTAMALCVGGAVLARAANDEDLVNRLSEACRAAVNRELRSA
jgi:TetR/AcrR family transcriptional repressor of nem operon